jgi:hypothetical protein
MSEEKALLQRAVADLAPDLPPPVEVGPHRFGGFHAVWRFDNGRGASVINPSIINRVELAVLRWVHLPRATDRVLDTTTPVTTDVRPIEDVGELIDVLRQIRDLPPPKASDPYEREG